MTRDDSLAGAGRGRPGRLRRHAVYDVISRIPLREFEPQARPVISSLVRGGVVAGQDAYLLRSKKRVISGPRVALSKAYKNRGESIPRRDGVF
jgi:hypothetical protein